MSVTSQILYKSRTYIGDIVIDKYYKYNFMYLLKSICLCDAQKTPPSPLEKKKKFLFITTMARDKFTWIRSYIYNT